MKNTAFRYIVPGIAVAASLLCFLAIWYSKTPVVDGAPNFLTALGALVSGLTLAALFFYAIDNHYVAKIAIEQYLRSSRPVIGFQLEEASIQQTAPNYEHHFTLVGSDSHFHAKVKVNLNARVNGTIVVWNPKYDGTEPWNVMAGNNATGHFKVKDILVKGGVNGQNPVRTILNEILNGGPLKDTRLELDIVICTKTWDATDDEYDCFPAYHFDYDFSKMGFIPRV
jgi:hypothetical protein